MMNGRFAYVCLAVLGILGHRGDRHGWARVSEARPSRRHGSSRASSDPGDA